MELWLTYVIGFILYREKRRIGMLSIPAGEDSPIESVISVINSLAISGCQLVFVTGRPDRIYYPTVDWLERYLPPTGTMIKSL